MLIVSLAERIAFINRIFGKGALTRDGRNYDVRCPLCADPDKTKRKLSINTTNDLNQCWVCGWSSKNLSRLIERFGTPEDLREYQSKFVGLRENEPERVFERPQLPSDFRPLAIECKTLMQKRVFRYLQSRGLTEDDLWRYRFGTSEDEKFHNRVIFPSFDANGNLNYFTARSIEKDPWLRYRNPPVNRREVIFNEMFVDWTKELVLCEGPFDSVKCGDNVVPLLGNRLSSHSRLFCKIVDEKTPVVIALDNEETIKTYDLVDLFSRFDVDVKVIDLSGHKDPGDMSKEDFALALKSAKRVGWLDGFMSRLRIATGTSLNTGSFRRKM